MLHTYLRTIHDTASCPISITVNHWVTLICNHSLKVTSTPIRFKKNFSFPLFLFLRIFSHPAEKIIIDFTFFFSSTTTKNYTTSKMSNLGALDMALDDVISQNRSSNKRSNDNNSRRGSTRRGGINKNRSSGGRSSVCY